MPCRLTQRKQQPRVPSASAGVSGPDATLLQRCRPLRLVALSLFCKAARGNPRDLAMILIAFRHGMRASEVCGLEVRDADMKNGEITIRRLKGSLKTTQPLAGSLFSLRSAYCAHG